MSIFALENESDFAAYLDPNFGHGITAVYTDVSTETSTNINVILNEEFINQSGESIDVESTVPMALCRSIDVINAVHGDTLVVASRNDLDGNVLKSETTYKIVSVQPDRTGFTMLILEEQ